MPSIAKGKPSKNQYRRQAKKAQKEKAEQKEDGADVESSVKAVAANNNAPKLDDFKIDEDDPLFEEFKSVIDKFDDPEIAEARLKESVKPEVFYDNEDDNIPSEDDENAKRDGPSKKEVKRMNKLTVAELKARVKKPEVVDWTDVSAPDPQLLCAIKSTKNIVSVPSHWALKREYLSSKRGIEKPPFALPKFIADTGITEMRDAVLEKQAEATLKQRQRERVAPKMGRMDIDYQKLYEAFFTFQTKPHLTRFGEVYYEGKEWETNLRHLRPGELGDDLKEALNMPAGAPPPWLINQQRFGPPPSYPGLRIPGLTAPPPSGATWGFHPGGYGKPPLDEFNRPLYGGDVFGTGKEETLVKDNKLEHQGDTEEKDSWGELLATAKEEEDDEEDEEDDEEDDEDGYGDGEAEDDEADREEMELAAGMHGNSRHPGADSTVPAEVGSNDPEGPDFTLRKQRRGYETEEPVRAAGQVIQERNVQSKGVFGSDRTYDIPGSHNPNIPMLGQDQTRKRKHGDVDVSVDVDALERDDRLSKDEVRKKYDAGRQANNPWAGQAESLDDMIAEEGAKRLKKDQERKGRR